MIADKAVAFKAAPGEDGPDPAVLAALEVRVQALATAHPSPKGWLG